MKDFYLSHMPPLSSADEFTKRVADIRKAFNNVVLNDKQTSIPVFCMKQQPKPTKIRVMFNAPATILWVGDKKFVSKAHAEEFDEEKGLLMCLAKANGISHLSLKKMLKCAERPKEKKDDKQKEE